MSLSKLVIVESPAKAKTIKKFLGRGYHVEASMGHVRDLPKSKFGIDVEKNFEPQYITIRGKGTVLNKLRRLAKKSDEVLLATDPDREGEAISWHLAHALGLPEDQRRRVVFYEITRDAVREAIKDPQPIRENLVDAQQARRLLDRLVGYKLSPLLWRKVRRGLSAGRVQSVAVRLIVDREDEINAFVPEEYWSLAARLRRQAGGREKFEARYHGDAGVRGKKEIPDKEAMAALLESLQGARFVVKSVRRRERRRNPAPPFTTSSLQQEASRKLGFPVRRTMRVAQQLYEGLSIPGEGSVGLITYMRTDSNRVADQAVGEAAGYIKERYGADYSQPRSYGKGKQRTQDAHEAIRPTSIKRSPEQLKTSLSSEQYRLYKLIWERFAASQMTPAIMDTVTVDMEAGGSIFRSTGSVVKFPGFMTLYIEGTDDEGEGSSASPVKETILPPLEVGEELDLLGLTPRQHFTQPPARYTEAMLVRALEENGIGRPSTYAPIIETIQSRHYVSKDNNRFAPTELGRIVTDLLREHFPDVVDVEFTAHMESELDRVEDGERQWRSLLQDFYGPFADTLEKAEEQIGRIELPEETTDEICEKCGRNMVIKHGRFGRFLACPGYPECKNTKPLLEKTGAKCPECGKDVVVRRSRRGRVFYGCSGYPECEFVSWYRPTDQHCPVCSAFLVRKGSKKSGYHLACSREGCEYTSRMGPAAAAVAAGSSNDEVKEGAGAPAGGAAAAGGRAGPGGRELSEAEEEMLQLAASVVEGG